MCFCLSIILTQRLVRILSGFHLTFFMQTFGDVRARLLASRDPYFVPSLVYVRETQYWVRVGLSKNRKLSCRVSMMSHCSKVSRRTQQCGYIYMTRVTHTIFTCVKLADADSDGDQYNNNIFNIVNRQRHKVSRISVCSPKISVHFVKHLPLRVNKFS